MTTSITTSTTDSQMHYNIMAAGSRDLPPMLAPGRYAQWQSRFLRYIDTRPNGDALRKRILEDAHTELQCLYLHKVKECECLAQKLSKQTKTVSKEVYNELL
nr:Gag-Pol polyprotein [Tanacetum cinerariifolium]